MVGTVYGKVQAAEGTWSVSLSGQLTTGGVVSSSSSVAVALVTVPQKPPSTTARTCMVPVKPDQVCVVVVLVIGNQVVPLVLRSQRMMFPVCPLSVSVPVAPGQ